MSKTTESTLRNNIFRFAVGIIISVSLVLCLLTYCDANVIKTLSEANKELILLALFMHGIMIFGCAFRLYLLLRLEKILISIGNIIKIVLIGLFFNLVIPSAIGGDISKIAIIFKSFPHKRTETVLTIFVDRAIGLFGLLLLGCLSFLLFTPKLNSATSINQLYSYFHTIIGFIIIAFLSLLSFFFLKSHVYSGDLKNKWFVMFEKFVPKRIGQIANKIRRLFFVYTNKSYIIFYGLLISFAIHCFYALTIFIIGRSIGESSLSFIDYLLVIPVAGVITAIPITPGGIGIRDLIIASYLGIMGVPIEISVAIPLAFTFIILVWGTLGGIVLLISFSKRMY